MIAEENKKSSVDKINECLVNNDAEDHYKKQFSIFSFEASIDVQTDTEQRKAMDHSDGNED